MFSPRWRKVLRELWHNKTRSLLVVISIAVGVAAVGVVTGSRAILAREMPAGYFTTDPANTVLITTPFDDDFVQSVRHMAEVRDAEGRRSVTMRLKTGPNEWQDLYLFALPDYDNIRVNKIEPDSGAWPPGDHEILIERAALPLAKAKVGDWVLVETPEAEQRKLHIVGLAHDQSRVPATFQGKVYGYVTFETLEWLGQPRDYNELYVTVNGDTSDRAYVRRVADRIGDKVEGSGRIVFSTSVPKPGKHPLQDPVLAIVMLLGVLGFLCLILSGFLVINTISAILAQQVRQIGVMKAIGARTRQVAAMYLGMALAFGLLAVAIGAPLGVLGACGLSMFVASLVNSNIVDLSIPPFVWALEAGLGLLTPLLAALYPVISGSRVTVREAISDYGLGRGQFGAGRVDRLLERLRGLPRSLLLPVRNTFRRKGRLLLTLSTLTLASAVFVAVTSVYASALASLDDVFRYWQHDVEFSFRRVHRIDKIEREAVEVPGVVKAEHWSLALTTRVRADDSEGETFWLYALPADTFSLQPNILEGRWLLPEDENAVVISNKFLDEEPDVKVGDQIVLKFNGEETSWRVVGNVHVLMADAPTLYVNYDYFARVMGTVGRADGVRVVTTQHDTASQWQVARALEEHFKSIGVRIASMVPISKVRTGIRSLFASIIAILLLMAIMFIAVGSLGLTGVMSLNVLERSREMGVMRAIGASDGAVLQIVLTEGMIIGVISWFFGSLIALPLSKVLSDSVGTALMQVPFTYTFSTAGAILWLFLVIVLTAVASVWPARRALRLAVRDALAYE